MLTKSQSAQTIRQKFLLDNKKSTPIKQEKNQNDNPFFLRPTQNNSLSPKKISKSSMPGFSFKLNFSSLSKLESAYSEIKIFNPYSFYPKPWFSDTEYPPTPPNYQINTIENLTPHQKNSPESLVKIPDNINTNSSYRRGEKLASSKRKKRKLIFHDFISKKIKI